MEHENKICENCKKYFTIEAEDFVFYGKMGVPAPTWCPYCRFIRKLISINERSLYKRTCGKCNKSIISMYAPDLPFPVWCVKCHLSDDWDRLAHGRDYDFSKTFFEQFKEMMGLTPFKCLSQNERNGEGCEYSNYCYSSKNVYLSFDSIRSENIKYCRHSLGGNKNCLDCLSFKDNDRCYEIVRSNRNYNSSFLIESEQCIDSQFLYDCTNCVNCCLSSNLRNKSFVFRNKQLDKEGYKKALAELKLDTYTGQESTKSLFLEVYNNALHEYAHIKNSVNAVGDYVENSKNVYNCYGIDDAEQVKNLYLTVNTVKDVHDAVFCGRGQECFEVTQGGRGMYRVVFSYMCGGGSRNLFYCNSCTGCADCFGCIGLNKQRYCILNKQYSEEEYERLIEKIKKHMDDMPYIDKIGRIYPFGECFPGEISPFAYNESIAFDELPLNKEQTTKEGYKWKEMQEKSYVPTIQNVDIPDSINDVADSICNEVIECPNKGSVETLCTSAFRILPDELAFYLQVNLPLPRYCPNCRYYQRKVWENPFRFYERSCMCNLLNHGHDTKCQNEFVTMYSPEKSEKIFCKECYQKEVY